MSATVPLENNIFITYLICKKTGTFLGVPVAKPGPEPTVVAQEKT
jgi:hypothetical protein